MNIILASASPRRQKLLSERGVDFMVIPADIEETSDFTAPADIVCDVSRKKAMAVEKYANTGDIIIGADTLVSIDGACLGKPADESEAGKMLMTLSGRGHEVYTGMTVLRNGAADTSYEVTKVFFKTVSEDEIKRYVKTKEPLDKAGAYGIQGLGAFFVDRIEGDYYNVIGLPLSRLYEMLRQAGIFLV